MRLEGLTWPMGDLYGDLARYYDALYHWKDYSAEVRRLRAVITAAGPPGDSLLDVACGTGRHLELLTGFQRTGIDLNPDMLAAARQRLPNVEFLTGDMRSLDLGRRFAVVTCLFSSIGYLETVTELQQTYARFARHLVPGGVLVVEPWFTPVDFKAGHTSLTYYPGDDLKIARLGYSTVEGRISVLEMEYLIAERDRGITHHRDVHRMGLFTREEHLEALQAAGIKARFEEEGLMEGRGLYVGKVPG